MNQRQILASRSFYFSKKEIKLNDLFLENLMIQFDTFYQTMCRMRYHIGFYVCQTRNEMEHSMVVGQRSIDFILMLALTCNL